MENVSMNRGSEVTIRSYNALNTIYHETQHEIANLNTQLCKRDNVIGELRAKLGKYERISINVEENETVLVGPSKSLIESLCKEISKLKKRKNELEVKAVQQADASQQEIQCLRARLTESERELQTLRSAPEHRKDQEIHALRCRLAAQDRDQATRAVLCSSLAEEADQLRVQLGVTVRTCQELLGRLEGRNAAGEQEGRLGDGEEIPREQKPEEVTEANNVLGENAAVCHLKEDNRQLKQRVAHVENLNARWQRYDSSRDDYVRVLCHRLRECSAQASSTAATTTTTTTSSNVRRAAGPGLLLLQQEVTRLNVLLADKMDEIVRQEETSRRDQERIQILEQRVLIYTDDFKWERADRERAQERIQVLQEQLHRLQQELHTLDTEEEGLKVRPVCRMAHTERQISPRRHGQQQQHLRTPLTPLQHHPEVAMAMPSPAWGHSQGQGELLCPRCQSRYSDADAVEFLNHCQECANLALHA